LLFVESFTRNDVGPIEEITLVYVRRLAPFFKSIFFSVIVGETCCAIAADAVDETRINNKIIAADAKAAEYNLLLVFRISYSLFLV